MFRLLPIPAEQSFFHPIPSAARLGHSAKPGKSSPAWPVDRVGLLFWRWATCLGLLALCLCCSGPPPHREPFLRPSPRLYLCTWPWVSLSSQTPPATKPTRSRTRTHYTYTYTHPPSPLITRRPSSVVRRGNRRQALSARAEKALPSRPGVPHRPSPPAPGSYTTLPYLAT